MPQRMAIRKSAQEDMRALWWRPVLNMQREINQNFSRMSSELFPASVLFGGEELLDRVQDNFSRLLGEEYNTFQMVMPWWQGKRTEPFIDIIEDDKGYRVNAEVPGVDEEDLSISLSDGALIIEGEKCECEEEEGSQYIHRECHSGAFSRTVAMPENADLENATASFEQNILTVFVPKKDMTSESAERSGTAERKVSVSAPLAEQVVKKKRARTKGRRQKRKTT